MVPRRLDRIDQTATMLLALIRKTPGMHLRYKPGRACDGVSWPHQRRVIMSARTQAYGEKLRNGEYDLQWMNVNSEWGVKATPSKRGLTLDDINIGSYGVIPEASDSFSFAPRGADYDPDALPSIGYTLNTRAMAWAENMGKLYEEAVARQWSSTRDVPWHTLKPLPKDIEHAMSQLCTFFTEVEFIAGDVPGGWLGQINNTYHETKLFMATQVMDEAPHLEVRVFGEACKHFHLPGDEPLLVRLQ